MKPSRPAPVPSGAGAPAPAPAPRVGSGRPMPTPPPNKAEVARMQRRQKIVEEILQVCYIIFAQLSL